MLSAETLAEIEREVGKYPADQKQSAVMSALRIVQAAHGWLSPEAMEAVAGVLGMPAIAVLEVASFYNMYDLQPVGKFKLTLCTNLPCALSGAEHAGEYLKARLGIEFGETTSDGRFTLKQGECMGACGDAPVLLVNNHRMCCKMTEAELDRLLAELGS